MNNPPVDLSDPPNSLPVFTHPNRGPDVAEVISLTTHPLVPGREGNIYLLCGRGDAATMQKVLDRAVRSQCPSTAANATAEGYFMVKARDEPRFLWRNMDGDQDPMKDVLVLWSKAGDKHDAETLKLLRDARDRLHGDLDATTADKPTFDAATKSYSGGLAFERNTAAVPLDDMKRAYPLTISHQIARDMDAPHKARKTDGKTLDDHARLVRDIVRVGGTELSERSLQLTPHKAGVLAGIGGLEDGSKDLANAIAARSDYLNVPRIGDYRNAYFPAVQLNISTAVSADDTTSLRDVLGPFGGNHVDCGDSAGGITAMTNMSFPHPDVEPEIMYFGDYKVAIVMEEFDTNLFNGLHCHGAVISRYNTTRTLLRPYHRNMIICYSPSKSFDVPGSSAQGSLPTAIGKERVWQIASEMKDWGIVPAIGKHASGQASFGIDGEAGLSGEAHFEHFVRAMLQFNAYIVNQFPSHYLMRIDKDKFLSAFSFVNDEGIRTGCKPWNLGPGWTGADTTIGTKYTQDLRNMPADQLLRLHNSDTITNTRYGNTQVAQHVAAWNRHLKAQSITIPLCVASDLSGINDAQPNPTLRRNVTKSIRKTAATHSTVVVSQAPAGSSASGGHSGTNDDGKTDGRTSDGRSARAGQEASSDEVRKNKKNKKGEKEKKDGDRTGKGKGKGKRAAAWDAYTTSDAEEDADSSEEVIRPKRIRQHRNTATAVSQEAHRPSANDEREGGERHPVGDECGRSERDGPQDVAAIAGRICNRNLVENANVEIELCIQERKDTSGTLSLVEELLTDLCQLLRTNDILGVWRLHSRLGAKQRLFDVSAVCHRGLALMVNMVSWQWLRRSMEKEYAAFRNKEDTWMAAFISKLDTFVSNPKKELKLHAKELFPNMVHSDKTHVLAPLKRRVFITESLDDYILLMEPILLDWFEFPQSPTNRVRAEFCEVVVEQLGAWALFLPEIGSICHDIKTITAGKTGRFPSQKVNTWVQSLRPALQAIATPETKDSIEEFGGLLETFSLGHLSASVLDQVYASAAPDRTALDNRGGVDKEAVFHFLRQIELLLPLIDRPHDAAPPSLEDGDSQGGSSITKYVKHVRDNGDKKLPFRDLAPSRRRVLEGDGPFSTSHLRTRAGLFSAAIHRGVTHNTPFLIEHSEIYFEDATHFRARIQAYPDRPRSFFCNPSAYGARANRTVDVAESLWDATGESACNSWLLGGPSDTVTFQTLWGLFSTAKFPTFGPLTAYLLAGDYAIAGIVPMPSFEEMAATVISLNKGALKGLRSLGYSCTDQPSTSSALQEVDAEIIRAFSAEVREKMKYNIFVLEHMLCKYGRLSTRMYSATM
ncbi:hypothetical protein CC2G_006781 [Coprinopsis cinerea AmutBmut pab1-1]|nr:hypothetical protein CC2G_006781 [Coprinopsis cinerea AmutBmut pab1-1]